MTARNCCIHDVSAMPCRTRVDFSRHGMRTRLWNGPFMLNHLTSDGTVGRGGFRNAGASPCVFISRCADARGVSPGEMGSRQKRFLGEDAKNPGISPLCPFVGQTLLENYSKRSGIMKLKMNCNAGDNLLRVALLPVIFPISVRFFRGFFPVPTQVSGRGNNPTSTC